MYNYIYRATDTSSCTGEAVVIISLRLDNPVLARQQLKLHLELKNRMDLEPVFNLMDVKSVAGLVYSDVERGVPENTMSDDKEGSDNDCYGDGYSQ